MWAERIYRSLKNAYASRTRVASLCTVLSGQLKLMKAGGVESHSNMSMKERKGRKTRAAYLRFSFIPFSSFFYYWVSYSPLSKSFPLFPDIDWLLFWNIGTSEIVCVGLGWIGIGLLLIVFVSHFYWDWLWADPPLFVFGKDVQGKPHWKIIERPVCQPIKFP